jgi:hypothetical protein
MDFMKTGRPFKYDILLPVLFSGGNRAFGVRGKIQSAGYTKHTKKMNRAGSHLHGLKTPLWNAVLLLRILYYCVSKPSKKGCVKAKKYTST